MDGSARNAAETFTRLDNGTFDSYLISAVGSDVSADMITDSLTAHNVNVDNVEKHAKYSTAIQLKASYKGENDTEKEIVHQNFDVFERVNYKQIYPLMDLINKSKVIYLDGNSNENAIKQVVKTNGNRVFFDLGDKQNINKFVPLFKEFKAKDIAKDMAIPFLYLD